MIGWWVWKKNGKIWIKTNLPWGGRGKLVEKFIKIIKLEFKVKKLKKISDKRFKLICDWIDRRRWQWIRIRIIFF